MVDQDFADTVIQFDDGLTITRGKHVFKAGYQMWRYRINTFYSGNSGEYGAILFGGSFSGDAGADFFLGYPEATGKGVSSGGTWHQLSWTMAGYGQDDWRVTPSLTLNLGLRYQAYTPWVELNNRQDNLDLVSGQIEYAGVGGNSRSLYNSVYGEQSFEPRIGFAWSPQRLQNKTVVRGAYTVSSYLEGTGTNLRLPRNPPFTPTEVTATYSNPTYTTQQGPGGSVAGDPFAGAVMYVWDKTVQPAMDQQWNLTVQDAITPATTLAGWLCRRARNAPHGSNTLRTGEAGERNCGTGNLLPGEPSASGRYLNRVRHFFDGVYALRCAAERAAATAF